MKLAQQMGTAAAITAQVMFVLLQESVVMASAIQLMVKFAMMVTGLAKWHVPMEQLVALLVVVIALVL